MKGSRWITDPDYTPRPVGTLGALPATRTELRGTGVGDEVPQGEGYVVVTGKYTWLGLYYDPADVTSEPEYVDVGLDDSDLIVYHSRETAEAAEGRVLAVWAAQGKELPPESMYPYVEPMYFARQVWESRGRCLGAHQACL